MSNDCLSFVDRQWRRSVFHLRIHGLIVHAIVLFRLRPLRPVFARTYSIPKLNGVKIDEYRPTCDTHYRLPRTSDATTFVWYALLHPFIINDNYIIGSGCSRLYGYRLLSVYVWERWTA